MADRYQVNSHQIRGEPREYWIDDLTKGFGNTRVPLSGTFDKRKAERQCRKLNGGKDVPKEQAKGRSRRSGFDREVIVRTAGWLAYLSKRKCREIKSCGKDSKFEVYCKGESANKRYPCLTHLGRVVNELLRANEEEDVE